MSFRIFAAAVSAAFFVTAVSPAFAITSGICFRMANVPANDGLNLRVKPRAKSRIVAHYANSSEVIIAKAGLCRSGWCKVSMHDGTGSKWGWVNARYLSRRKCP